MPIEFNMRIATDQSPEAVLDRVINYLGIHESRDHAREHSINCLDAITESSFAQELIQASFEFKPTVMLNIQLDKFGDLQRGKDLVVDAIKFLLLELPGEILVLEDNESALLLRRNGVVFVQSKSDFWSPSRLSRLSFTIEAVELPKWME